MKLYIHDCKDGYSLIEDGKILFDSTYLVAVPIYEFKETANGGIYRVGENQDLTENMFRVERLLDYEVEVAGHKIPVMKSIAILNDSVIEWLNSNIKPKPDGSMSFGYRKQTETLDFEFFFYRKNDVSKFIRYYSKLGKPSVILDERKWN